jgi:glyoxylase-like metal-dependent hydrolase (beta-lactamase superfamily II)
LRVEDLRRHRSRRDVGIYLDAAKDLGLRITHILETHLHADFVSGHMDLAEKTGAKIYVPEVELSIRTWDCPKGIPLKSRIWS